MIKRTLAEKILLSLSLLVVVVVTPFALIRWQNNEITMAIADATISVIMIVYFIIFFKIRNTEAAQKTLAFFLLITVIVIVTIQGENEVHWLYPIIFAFFYLISLKLAAAFSAISIFSVLFIIYPTASNLTVLTVAMTSSITTVLIFFIFNLYNTQLKESERLATIDPLTSTGNRRLLDENIAKNIQNQNRQTSDLCLLLLDIDNFKAINDIHGHAVGDKVLQSICSLIRQNTRILDSLYRYGGDEFILMPLYMNITSTKQLATKICHLIEQHNFPSTIKVTLSVGAAQYKQGDTPDQWIKRADEQLYKAKNNGRNNVQ